MFQPMIWEDRVTEYKDRYRETQNPDGTYTHTRVEGEIIQEGTPHNQSNMNALGFGIMDAHLAMSLLSNLVRQNGWMSDHLSELVSALQEANAGFASDIAGLKSTDTTHTSNIAALQTAAEDADLRLLELAFAVRMNVVHTTQLDRILMEERHKVTLENTLAFPFNSTVNSPATIALDKVRDNAEYSVEAEVLSHNGPVGEIEVTAKARNGFKISYSGSGSGVTLLVKVKGGMS